MKSFPPSHWKGIAPLAWIAACLLAFALFLIIALTQSTGEVRKHMHHRKMLPIPLPALPRLISEELKMETETKTEMPILQSARVKLPIHPLQLDLNPRMNLGSPDLSMDLSLDFSPDFSIENVDQEDPFFDFAQLSQIPILLNVEAIRFDYPRDLSRKGIREIKVLLEIVIDKKGRARVEDIVSLSQDHPQIRETIRRAISQARFSITKMAGRAVKVRGRFPLTLKAPR